MLTSWALSAWPGKLGCVQMKASPWHPDGRHHDPGLSNNVQALEVRSTQWGQGNFVLEACRAHSLLIWPHLFWLSVGITPFSYPAYSEHLSQAATPSWGHMERGMASAGAGADKSPTCASSSGFRVYFSIFRT